MKIELNPRTYLAIAVSLVVSVCATVQADYIFGTPTNLGPEVNSSGYDIGPTVSQDELTIIFNSPASSYTEEGPLLVATRASTDDSFGVPVRLDPTMFSGAAYPSISADGLSLYFEAAWPGGSGVSDIWMTTRATLEDQWGTPVNLGPVVNSPYGEGDPSISSDGLALLFISTRPDGLGEFDIWLTTRAGTDEPWRDPVNLGHPVNTSGEDALVEIARDGSMLYFASTRPGGSGGMDLWQVSIEPIVDLNGDGIVDSADMCIIVDRWGEDYSLCDIGPMPWGDGIVDVQDLIVLAEHLFEEPGLIAHWALDETDGDIAQDSAGDNFGFVVGSPVWQPTGGQVNGAIELDGVDDVIIAASPLNLADPEISSGFSVFVWIKGGAPGQAVISEPSGANWLGTDPLEGHLMTGLTSPGRSGGPLLSQTAITDGQWHRIGFVWDGFHRTLYVDGIAVAEDTQDDLASSSNGLYIGTGKAMQPGTFFSGLIDDVRIYDRVVVP